MNIAIFVKNLTSGGAEKQSVLLAKAMTKYYPTHYLIFNGEKIHQRYLDMLKEDSSIQIKYFKGNHIYRYNQFLKYLKDNNINYIFSYLTAANAYACLAGKLNNIKVFTGLRNAKLPLLKCLTDCFLTNYLAKGAIANCFSGKEYFTKKGFQEHKITVIPNCFENIKPYISKPIKTEVRIITVGRFVPQKDYETAIRSISELKKLGCQINFDIVGYGNLEAQIKNWIQQYNISDITHLYINPNNIEELLDNADIYLSTSLYEGTSNSIMEAMNVDLPIVATNVGDNKYLVHNNENGYLLRTKDYINISKYLKTLAENSELRQQQGKKSKDLLLKNFSMDIFTNHYISLLNEKI